MRRVIILGSTGSIGTQALEVIRANPGRFEVVGLVGRLATARPCRRRPSEFQVEHTALGADEAEQLVRDVEADVVLNGITGSVGLGPTLAALETGRTLALANKESLIVGGDLVTAIAQPGQIVPVDSEHSAIAQALRSGDACRGAATRADGIRRPVPRPHRASRSRRDPRRGARAPDLGHGPRGHDELRDPRQQGPRGDRGAPAVRRRLRRHRRRGASAVDRALDGRVRRRLDDRAGVAARHAAADLARPRLAEPGRRGRATDRLDGRGIVDVRAARRRRRSPPCGSPRGRPRGRHLSGRVQRGQRAGRRRVPRGPAVVPGHRRARSSASSTRTTPRRPRAARSRASIARRGGALGAGCRRPRDRAASEPAESPVGGQSRAGRARASAARARASRRRASARRASSRAEYGVRTPRMSR